jgi:hypothetical protein
MTPRAARPRRSLTLATILCASLALSTAGCTMNADAPRDGGGSASSASNGGSNEGFGSRPTPVSRREQTAATAGVDGPFDGARWSGDRVPVHSLLHDDGRRLWSIDLRGRRVLVWRHSPAAVTSIAAAPNGTRLAVSIALDPRNGSQPAYVLYELRADGSVRAVDRTHEFRSIDAPVYLRAPTGPADARPRLYWMRTGEAVDDLGRLDTQVMVDARGAREVRVPLRFAETVFDIAGYPGANTFTFTLFRQNDIPARAEVLRNDDARAPTTPASLSLWGNNEPRAETDVLNGVAWLTPTDYVVPVAQRFHASGYALRLFRIGCEELGSHVVYRGSGIDWGYSDLPWRLQPAGGHRILVLSATEARAAGGEPAEEGVGDRNGGGPVALWRAVDLRTGRMRPTRVAWRPGAWTWVEPDGAPAAGQPTCDQISWTWP